MPRYPNLNNDSVILRGVTVDLDSAIGQEFVVDCTRAGEGLLTDDELKEKYELSSADWENITRNKALINALRDEWQRRVRNGTAAREVAAQHFIKAPAVLGEILNNKDANPRHRIESARELRATATSGGGENSAENGKIFKIVINLGEGHIETYEKEIAPLKSVPVIEDKSDGE
jgi:hypothetical protein